MSLVRRSFERLLNHEPAEDRISGRARAIGHVAVPEDVRLSYGLSIDDLDAMYNGLPQDLQEDPTIATLYEAATYGNLPVGDVMQYMQAYGEAVSRPYGQQPQA